MKELSIEQKATAYDKAVEKIKYVMEHGVSPVLNKEDLQDIFPQLKESEDEDKIMKELIYNIIVSTDYTPSSKEIFSVYGKTKEDAFAWLEKQGEQNTSDNGIAENIKAKIIDYFDNHLMLDGCFSIGGLRNDILSIVNEVKQSEQNLSNKVESKFHEGDWVIDKQGIAHQIANVVENVTNHTYGYDIVGGGYFNDTEGVRLWTIQDAKDGDVLAALDYILIFKEFLKNDGGISYCHYDFGAGNPQFIWSEDKNWYFGKEAIIHPATKEQRELLFQKMKESGYEWDADKKELKKIEQNPAWSKEDEEKFSFIHAILIDAKSTNNCASNSTYYREVTESIEWLKSLKDRVHPQPKQEWSEEDEKIYKSITYSFAHNYPLTVQQQEFVKSIRPQNTWKPSDEQMERLNGIIYSLPHQEVLYSLYQDLKKLKE